MIGYIFVILWLILVLIQSKMPSKGASTSHKSNGLFSDLKEQWQELRYGSLNEYRSKVMQRIHDSFDNFMSKQSKFAIDSQRDLKNYRDILSKLYSDTVSTKRKQQEALDDLTKQSLSRPMNIDESLDSFRRVYNDSVSLFATQFKPFYKTPSYDKALHREQQRSQNLLIEPFTKQIDRLNHRLTHSWDSVLTIALDVTTRAEHAFQSTVEDLHGVQNNILSNAKGVLRASVANSLTGALNRDELMREVRSLDSKLKALEKEGHHWIDHRIAQIESSIKLMQEKIATSNSAYEELLTKRRASLYYTAVSDACLSQVLKLTDLKSNPGWKLIREEDGYLVYRKMMGIGPGSKYACVMCHGIINAPPKDVFALFEDNTRVPEYNSFYERGRDIEVVAENTKITWTATPPVFPFKPRDFCTLIHMRRLKDGTFVILNKATTHPEAPHVAGYVRGSIVLAANIIQPIPGDSRKSRLTMLTQLDPGGFAPPVAINHVRFSSNVIVLLPSCSHCASRPPLLSSHRSALWGLLGS